MYLPRVYEQALAYSLDPDQTPQNAASSWGLHHVPLIQQFLNTRTNSKVDSFKV